MLTVLLRHFNGDFEFVGQLSSAILSPAAFVYAGTKTAPRHRLTIAISLTVLHAMLLAAMFGFIAYGLFVLKTKFKDPVWWDATRAAVGVVVTVATCVLISREERDSVAVPDRAG